MADKYLNVKTPVGLLKIIASQKGVRAILWQDDDPKRVKILDGVEEDKNNPILLKARTQLERYFAGGLRKFTLPLDMEGTEFQRQVWRALLEIPFGETRSYGDIAKRIKRPLACRAVGAANGKNPVSIMVPCHRVIGASGKLTGFAGGLDIKSKLLALESTKV